jgi:DNA-binding MarR family transcriptional regulator
MSEAKAGLYASTGYWVTRLARAMESDLERRLAMHGVTRAMWAVLGAIVYDGKSTPSALSSFIGIDRAAVTRHVDRIVEEGLVSRERDAEDRRCIKLEVTAKGRRLVPKLAAESKATNEKFLAGLTRSEAHALREAIREMLSNSRVALGDI